MKSLAVTTAAVALLAGASNAWAETVVALTGDNALATIDTTAMSASAPVAVTGVDGRLLGIDWRPSDGMLYGLFSDGTVATIDPAMFSPGTYTLKLTSWDTHGHGTVDEQSFRERHKCARRSIHIQVLVIQPVGPIEVRAHEDDPSAEPRL